MARYGTLDLRAIPKEEDRKEALEAFRTRARRELERRYPAAGGHELTPRYSDDRLDLTVTVTRGALWGVSLTVHPEDAACRRVTVVLDAESRGVGKVMAWIGGLAAILGILVGVVSVVAGTIESGMPRRSLAGGIVLGAATALAVAVAGLLVVLPLRQALSVSRKTDFDDVERILERVWGDVRAEYAGLPPLARRLSPQAKGLLATVLSCGTTAGLWFGAQAANNQGVWIALVVLACVGAVISFGCVVGTLFFILVPGVTFQRPPEGEKTKEGGTS